jgi:hypothetical protein
MKRVRCPLIPNPEKMLFIKQVQGLKTSVKCGQWLSKIYFRLHADGWYLYPSHPGSRDQEDRGLKPAWTNSSQDLILKTIHHKKGMVEWLKVWALTSTPMPQKKKIYFRVIVLSDRDLRFWGLPHLGNWSHLNPKHFSKSNSFFDAILGEMPRFFKLEVD